MHHCHYRPSFQPSVSRIGYSPHIGGSAIIIIITMVQLRQFLGCGDGEEGVLSKTYEERRVLGYSPEQLFDVVAAVDFYHGFVPWCQRSDILRHYPDGSFDAELEIGFKFLIESYISHVQLDRPKHIKGWSSLQVAGSACLKRLHRFNLCLNEQKFELTLCLQYIVVDIIVQLVLLEHLIASMFFKEVASRMVGSFTERCRVIYGPEVRVLENSYEKRA
ncbi:Coenzyme Q-binding protein COQ10-like B [Spatholobus suberectus]|nr:Coenzyme Q-binding protein COQ10-like B [Spatholobus suberectus]